LPRTRRSIYSPLLAVIAAIGTIAVHAIPVSQSAAATATGAEKHRSSIVAECAAVLAKGRLRAQQRAFATLGAQPGSDADQVLIEQFKRYNAGKLSPALWLDLLEAVAKRDNADLKSRLAEHERNAAASQDPLRPYRECLEGGDADAGREIFTKKPEAGCIRCHRAGGEGGQIGPDLTTLHQTTERIFILESIVEPNAVIAPGFQNVLLTLKNGETVTGILSFETEDEVVITSVVDGKKRKIPAAEIKERTPLPSAMPPGFGIVLGKRAIRDLVQFLATME
jgi:quinoprotein glucose dehydrogenase